MSEELTISEKTTKSKLDQDILDKYMSEVEQAKRGEVNVFDVATRLNEMQKSLNDLYEELKDEILEEREKYSDKEEIICNGYEIKIGGRKYYGYSHDPQHELIKERLKAREKMMKRAAQMRTELVDNETGEVVEPATIKARSWPVLKYVGGKS